MRQCFFIILKFGEFYIYKKKVKSAIDGCCPTTQKASKRQREQICFPSSADEKSPWKPIQSSDSYWRERRLVRSTFPDSRPDPEASGQDGHPAHSCPNRQRETGVGPAEGYSPQTHRGLRRLYGPVPQKV